MSAYGLVGALAGFAMAPAGLTGMALFQYISTGFSIGNMVNGFVNPAKGPDVHGPRLSDLSVQTSSYGAVIPRVYGTVAVMGNVFWVENNKVKEVVTETEAEGGKGGGGGGQGSTYTYSYYGTFAVGLCKGPILGVKRIWIGGKLFYDASETDYFAAATTARNGRYFTLYLGDDTQAADPRMQATLGAVNVPAYRGLAYIVFKDLPLADYNNSIAGTQVKVEIVQSGEAVEWNPVNRQALGTVRGVACDGKRAIQLTDDSIWISQDGGVTYAETDLPASLTTGRSVTDGEGMTLFIGASTTAYVLIDSEEAMNWYYEKLRQKTEEVGEQLYSDEAGNLYDGYGNVYPPGWQPEAASFTLTEVGYIGATTLPFDTLGDCAYANGYYCAVPASGADCALGYFDLRTVELAWESGSMPAAGAWKVAADGENFVAVMYGGGGARGVMGDVPYWDGEGRTVTWTAGDLPTGNWIDAAWDGSFFVAIEASSQRTAKSADGLTWTVHAGALPSAAAWTCLESDGDGLLVALSTTAAAATSEDSGETWTARTMSTTGAVGLAWNTAYFVAACSGTYAATIAVNGIETGEADLADIVTAEAEASGVLEASDIDVTLLTDTVRGYRIGAAGSLRSALEPLQACWQFDVVQSGYIVKFIPRSIPLADDDFDGVRLLAHLDDTVDVAGHTLTALNGAAISAAESKFGGYALALPDADSCIRVSGGDIDDFAFAAADSFTFECWAYLDAAGTAQRIFSGDCHMTVSDALDSIVFGDDAGAYWSAAATLTEGWHHLAFVCNAGDGTFFIDGEATAATLTGTPTLGWHNGLRIGA